MSTEIALRRVGGKFAVMMVAAGVLAGCGSTTAQSPAPPSERVTAFFKALQSADQSACDSLVPSQRAKCHSDWGQMNLRGEGFTLHRTIISGDRAMVSMTGTSCSVAGCHTVSDPGAGMPSATVTFDDAWNVTEKAAGSSVSAVVRLRLVEGSWYIQG